MILVTSDTQTGLSYFSTAFFSSSRALSTVPWEKSKNRLRVFSIFSATLLILELISFFDVTYASTTFDITAALLCGVGIGRIVYMRATQKIRLEDIKTVRFAPPYVWLDWFGFFGSLIAAEIHVAISSRSSIPHEIIILVLAYIMLAPSISAVAMFRRLNN